MNEFNRQHIAAKLILVVAVSFFFFLPRPLHAGSGYRSSGAKFLTIGGGGRALALAETYVAEGADPFVVFYNPSALAGDRPTRVGLAHNEHFQSMHGEYVALSAPAGRMGVGIGLQLFAINDIPKREGPTEQPLIEFDATNALIVGAAGYRITEKVSAGLSVKGIFEKIDAKVANGIAFDLGGIYRPIDRLTVGAAFNHLGPEMSFDEGSYKLPILFRLGGAYSTSRWTARGELVSPNNEATKFHLGGEYVFNVPMAGGPAAIAAAYFALRAGYAFGYDTRSWAAGLGIGVERIKVDYAFAPYSDDLGDTHHFSLSITL